MGVYIEHPPPHCKAVLGRKFYPLKIRPQNSDFSGIKGLNVKFLFSNPETSSFGIFCVKIGSGAWAVGRWKNPEDKEAEF